MEAKLRKKSAHLLAAQRIANLGSWEFDLNTKEITWSLEVFRIFGRDPALGEPTFEELQTLLHPEDCDCHAQLVQRTIATGEPYKIEYRFYHSDGSLRYALAQARTRPE
ncbi:MAG: PAS domain-containing protein [Coleofasciculaceae cyanobacterium SM2_3_26]|nr:PAS domain-containing protein [Coleofasciculaceae cyanobacterium SM2_3_26]